jgi:hypothetical protein
MIGLICGWGLEVEVGKGKECLPGLREKVIRAIRYSLGESVPGSKRMKVVSVIKKGFQSLKIGTL